MSTSETEENSEKFYPRSMFPPGDLDSDEPPVESELHRRQIMLLLNSLEWLWRDRNTFFAGANLTIHNTYPPKENRLPGPDFFVVLKTEKKYRKSWVVWEEGGKYPNIIIELLSDKTADIDRNEKKKLYQTIFRNFNYFWFDPNSFELAGFLLVGGEYQPIEPNSQGWLWSEGLELYLGIYDNKLRFFTPEGELVPTPEEAAELERLQKELVQQKVSKLAAKLRELGIDPDSL